MISTLISFSALYISVFTLLLGTGFLGFFLSLRMTLQGFSALLTGWIMAAYFLGMVLGSFFCQRLIQGVGHIRSFAAFAAIATTTVLLHGLYADPWFWWLLRLLTGITTMGLYMVIESWLNECTEPQFRGRVFAMYMLTLCLGVALGQLFPIVSDVHSQAPFFVVGIFFSICLVPIAVTRTISPKIPDVTRFNLFVLLKKAPLGMLGCLSAGLINGAFYAMGPVFGNQIGLTVSRTAGFMAVTIFGSLLFQWPIGIISDRFNRAVVLSLLSVLAALGGMGIIMLPEIHYALFLFLMVLYGGLIFTIYPVSVARTHDLFETTDIVPVSSALLLSYGIGASLGPIIASGMMTLLNSPYGLFVFFSLTAGLFALFSFYLVHMEKIKVLPVSAQVKFAPMKNSSPVASQLDPRTAVDRTDGAF
ncbi:MAG: MFS transporter [Desulfobacterales bacterium]|nr:MFS transporter [Desulfobacterales bacterium]